MNTIMGSRLKELRKSRHLTQDELASQLNERFGLAINKSMISKWENGKGDPYLSYAKFLAFHFGVDLDYLVGLSDKRGFTFYFDGWEENREFECNTRKNLEHLSEAFASINSEGQEKILEYADDLVSSNKYAVSKFVPLHLLAAHDRTDVEASDEEKKHDIDILNDDNF